MTDIVTANNFLRLILQAAAIVALLIPVVYYPVKTKLDAIYDIHSRDCAQIYKESEILRKKMINKVDEISLGLRLDPLAKEITELKTEVKEFRQETIKFFTK